MARRPALTPTDPTPLTKYTARSVRAFYVGEATADQQKHLFEWIVKKVANIGGASIVPGMPDVTGFLEGRRYVGRQIVDALESKIDNLPEKVTDE